MGLELQASKYIVGERTFIVRDLDMERVATKKVEQRAKKLPANKQEVFRRLTDVLGSVILWERFNRHVNDALTSTTPLKRGGNIYDLEEDINKVLNRIEKWVRRNREFSDEKVKEFAINIYRSSKSICRMFDQNATCWKKGAEEAVAANV
jgi:hypothetical protein